MSKKEEIGIARAAWRTKKDACIAAGAPAGLFGSDDLGPQLDKMQELVWIVERGKASPQDAKGSKALEKAKADALAVTAELVKTVAKYRDRVQKALQTTTAVPLKAALRDAAKCLEACEKITSKARLFLRA